MPLKLRYHWIILILFNLWWRVCRFVYDLVVHYSYNRVGYDRFVLAYGYLLPSFACTAKAAADMIYYVRARHILVKSIHVNGGVCGIAVYSI